MKPLCHICNTPSSFLLNKDDYDLYECPTCKLVFVYPQPTEEMLQKKLYSYESGYQANAVRDLSQRPEGEREKRVLDYFEKIQKGGKILDVGCAGGQFLYWAKMRGFQVAGVELNKRTADSAIAQGFNVYTGFVVDALFEPASFDFVFLGEIIEHVNNPREFVRECAKFLKPGGIMAITTPNLDCFWSRSTFILYKFFGIPWSSVTPPYHLSQFSAHNLDLLLQQEKFALQYTSFIMMSRLKYELGMLHLLKRYKKSKKISDLLYMVFSYILYIFLYILNLLLNPFLKKEFNVMRFYKKSP